MFTVDELLKKIADYRNGSISLEQFDNWFEDNSIGAYASPDVREAYAAVESVLAQYYFDHIGEQMVKAELENAMLPFGASIARFRFAVPLLPDESASTAVPSSWRNVIDLSIANAAASDFTPKLLAWGAGQA